MIPIAPYCTASIRRRI